MTSIYNRNYSDDIISEFFEKHFRSLKKSRQKDIEVLEKSFSTYSCPINIENTTPENSKCSSPKDRDRNLRSFTLSRLTRSNPELKTSATSICSLQNQESSQCTVLNTHNFLTAIRNNLSLFKNLFLIENKSAESKNKLHLKCAQPSSSPCNIRPELEEDNIENLRRMSDLSKELLKKFDLLKQNIQTYSTLQSRPSNKLGKSNSVQTTKTDSEFQTCLSRQLNQINEVVGILLEIFAALKEFQQCSFILKEICKDNLSNRSLTALSKISSTICTNLVRLHSNKHLLNYIHEKLIDAKILMWELVNRNSNCKKVVSVCECYESKISRGVSHQNIPIIVETPQNIPSSARLADKNQINIEVKYSEHFQTLSNMINEISEKIDTTLSQTIEIFNDKNLSISSFKKTSENYDHISRTSVGVQYEMLGFETDSYYKLLSRTIPSEIRIVEKENRSRGPLHPSIDSYSSESQIEFVQKIHFYNPNFFPNIEKTDEVMESSFHRIPLTKDQYTTTVDVQDANRSVHYTDSKDLINLIHKLEAALYLRKPRGDVVDSFNEARTSKILSIINDLKKNLFLKPRKTRDKDRYFDKLQSRSLITHSSKGIQTYLAIKPHVKSYVVKKKFGKNDPKYRNGLSLNHINLLEKDIQDSYILPIQSRIVTSSKKDSYEIETPKKDLNKIESPKKELYKIQTPKKDSNNIETLKKKENNEWLIDLNLQSNNNVTKNVDEFVKKFAKQFNLNPSRIKIRKGVTPYSRNLENLPNLGRKTKHFKPSEKYKIDEKGYQKLAFKKLSLQDNRNEKLKMRKCRKIKKRDENMIRENFKKTFGVLPPPISYKKKEHADDSTNYINTILEDFSNSGEEELSVREIEITDKEKLLDELRRRGAPSLIVSKPNLVKTLAKWLKEKEYSS